jgi:glucosylceramidase
MSHEKRHQLLTELFAFDEKNIGVSLGASDLDAGVFSKNDLHDGETDLNTEVFHSLPTRNKSNTCPAVATAVWVL